MKPKTTKTLFAFIATIMLSVSILVLYNSCRKARDVVAAITKTTLSSNIIYTDVIPDSTVKCVSNPVPPGLVASISCSSVYYLDLNKDGTNDFSITLTNRNFKIPNPYTHLSKTNSNISITSFNGNASVDSVRYSGNTIDGSLTWSTASKLLASTTNPFYTCGSIPPIAYFCWRSPIIAGSWSGQSDKYLPLKIIVGTKTYYGWARLSVATGGTSFTIKDYAYNSIANQSILAGQTK